MGDKYAGAIGPSIVQVLLLCVYIFLGSVFRPHHVPALPPEARQKIGWLLTRGVDGDLWIAKMLLSPTSELFYDP